MDASKFAAYLSSELDITGDALQIKFAVDKDSIAAEAQLQDIENSRFAKLPINNAQLSVSHHENINSKYQLMIADTVKTQASKIYSAR